MTAAAVLGHDMVHGQLATALAAVLAGEVVPYKDLATGELNNGPGAPNLVAQPNHRGARKRSFRTTDDVSRGFQNLGFTERNQDKSPTPAADVKGLEILVQNQDNVSHGHSIRAWPSRSSGGFVVCA